MTAKKTEEITPGMAAIEEITPDTLVPVYLFKDSGKYKDDVFVAVNGESCLIQRGKQVMVKKKFADVLQRSAEQDAKTAEMIQGYEDEFDSMSRRLNL